MHSNAESAEDAEKSMDILVAYHVGGIDFGWRNPFAAVWGVLDAKDVLWITNERYLRETPISEHAAALPRDVIWFGDPAGRTEMEEMRRAGHVVKKGKNDIRLGIAMVTERIRTGKLKVLASCRNLIRESKLYRYPTARERAVMGENPIDADNHALAALRYLVAGIEHFIPPADFNSPSSHTHCQSS